MFTFVCLFLLPLVIMIFCYTRILVEISSRIARNNSKASRSLSVGLGRVFWNKSSITKTMIYSFPVVSRDIHLRRSHNNIPKARMRTLKMSIVIVTSFIICWTPYYLLGLWYWLFPEKMEETVSHSLTHMLFIFGLFNACLDPITYGLFTIHLRQGARRRRQISNAQTELENNSCLMQMSCLSAHRQNVSSGLSKHTEEINDNSSTKNASSPTISVSRI